MLNTNCAYLLQSKHCRNVRIRIRQTTAVAAKNAIYFFYENVCILFIFCVAFPVCHDQNVLWKYFKY